ncbi:MAG: GtrA family protein [Bacteroidales bacterium]
MNVHTKVIRLSEKILTKRFMIFLLVGGVNTIFGYGIFALCIYLKLHYSLASFISTVLGVLFNFKTTGVIVFKNKNNSLIFKYLFVYGISFCIGLILLFLLNQMGINNYIGGAILILPGAVIAYTLQRILVFAKKDA